MLIIGLDPGLKGALAALDTRSLLITDVQSLPVKLKKGNGRIKNEIDTKTLVNIIDDILSKNEVTLNYGLHFCLERVSSRPGQDCNTVFSLGDSYGALRAVCSFYQAELTTPTPKTWKSYLKLTSDKQASLSYAKNLFPESEQWLKFKKDHDRAEAILLAYYVYCSVYLKEVFK